MSSRRQSQPPQLSRLMLPHQPRHLLRWLSFNVRPSEYHAVRYIAAILAMLCKIVTQAAASPLPAKSGFGTVNGVKVHYVDWGGSGETIVFLARCQASEHV